MPVPAEPGLATVNVMVPEVAIADAGTATVRGLLLMNVVFEVWAVPFQFTTALEPKLVPFMIKGEGRVTRSYGSRVECCDCGDHAGYGRHHPGAVAAGDGEFRDGQCTSAMSKSLVAGFSVLNGFHRVLLPGRGLQ